MKFWEVLFQLLFGRSAASRRPPAPVPPASPPRPPSAPSPIPSPTPGPGPSQPDPTPPPFEQAPQQPSFSAEGPMIELGCVDAGVSNDQCAAYLGEVERITNVPLRTIAAGLDKVATKRLDATPNTIMSVADIQRALTQLGFFPGGRADGIFGYRTQSALRLFQEYVRTMDNMESVPDGRIGPQTRAHLLRWMQSGRRPDWQQRDGEFNAWLGLLQNAKQKYLQTPTPVIQKVNEFRGVTNTRRVADWNFNPGEIHLIGVRRNQAAGKFDDIFVLLIKGLVFKFQGSTEPGASENPAGPPHLVPGQHEYRFGWHQSKYLALRPLPNGVLVVRAGADRRLDPGDLERGLETNGSINIHWGGLGMARNVGNWSEGCQVINGTVYMNPSHHIINCGAFAATSPNEAMTQVNRTRGAYNVLVDLVTALSGDMASNSVKYTLLMEEDLALNQVIERELADARQRVQSMA